METSAPPYLYATPPVMALEPRGRVLQAAIHILADGKPRTADDILAIAVAQRLIPETTTRKYVYTSLIEYIARAVGHDRKPAIVQEPDRSFRINHPLDDWPDIAPVPPSPGPTQEEQRAIDQLRATATGDDPLAFEQAVCDAFTLLGFASRHVGGAEAPDGILDAQLGVLAYRVMLECKTAKPGGTVTDPDVFEAAKYRDAYGAQHCVLIGPAFKDEIQIASELQTHGVSLWTIDDLIEVITARIDPLAMRALFAPGLAADAIPDLLWERTHGQAKRIRTIARYIVEEGWAQQVAAQSAGPPADAPILTVDAAMMLVDARLKREAATRACARADVQSAIAWLTHPLVGAAAVVAADGARPEGIVVVGRS